MKRAYLISLFLIAGVCAAPGQMLRPILWSASVEMRNDTAGVVSFDAKIEKGWHLYGLSMPPQGPKATSISFEEQSGVDLVGELTPSREPIEKTDDLFGCKLSWWDADVTFRQEFKIIGGESHDLRGTISFQGCNDESCISPVSEPFNLKVGPETSTSDTPPVSSAAFAGAEPQRGSAAREAWWAPVASADSAPRENPASSRGYIFLWGFIGGLLALLTPCIWPMIPLTIGFFMKKNVSKARSVRDALIYGAGIIVIFLVLGLVITQIYGAGKLNELATGAVFNLIFFALLLLFAISFLGGFEMKLPSKWANAMDGRAERTTGVASIFFMAFTLVLVSFSCTGPIIGTLLVEAASLGSVSGPAIGMGAFALALAIPFALFAIFPSWLKRLPRSGGWLDTVKTVLGFLELAFSLKFLSVADLAYGWGLLDRKVFISLWMAIFLLLGLYLLGKIVFSADRATGRVSVFRFFLALCSLGFAVYLLPGLWGAPLKGVGAFLPPMHTRDFDISGQEAVREFDDYDLAMRYAAGNDLPVLVDFSGYGCVNCRKMEASVLDDDRLKVMIRENYVVARLMVDDKRKLDEPFTVDDSGKQVKIGSIGEKWSYLQRHKFASNSQPYYVIVDGGGNLLAGPVYYTEDKDKFMRFLKLGITNYEKKIDDYEPYSRTEKRSFGQSD